MTIRKRGLIVVCITDTKYRNLAAFQVENRRQATQIRKLLFSLLPKECHPSIRAWPETREQYTERSLAISERAGAPPSPIKWFMLGAKLPDRLEDLQTEPNAIQSYLEEREKWRRTKPL